MRSQLLAATAITFTLASSPLQAAPVMPDLGSAATLSTTSVETVQYRGRYGGGARFYGGRGYGGRGYGWGYRGGAWPWVGLAAGVAAGAIIYNQTYRPRVGYYYDTYDYNGPYYYPSGYSGNPRDICARNFKSFEWGTGMYTTYGGERRLCPYLQ